METAAMTHGSKGREGPRCRHYATRVHGHRYFVPGLRVALLTSTACPPLPISVPPYVLEMTEGRRSRARRGGSCTTGYRRRAEETGRWDQRPTEEDALLIREAPSDRRDS